MKSLLATVVLLIAVLAFAFEPSRGRLVGAVIGAGIALAAIAVKRF